MSIFKKPTEREVKNSFCMLIYGMPGCGKSTLACSAPSAVMIDFENGIHRVSMAHRVPSFTPNSWTEVMEAINEICTTPEIKSVVVDSVDRLLEHALEHVRVSYPSLVQKDGTPSLKAYGKRKDLYKDFVTRLRNSGKNIIYVAHIVEDRGSIGGEDVIMLRPNIGKNIAPDITTDLDMEGLMMRNGNSYLITFDSFGNSESKNTFGIHGDYNQQGNSFSPLMVDNLSDGKENTFLSRLFKYRIDCLERERQEFASREGGAQ